MKKKSTMKEKSAGKIKIEEISDPEVGQDVIDFVLSSQRRKISGKKVPANIPPAPLDNISFHFESGASRWRYVYHIRLARERAACECCQVQRDHVFDQGCWANADCDTSWKMI